MFDLFRLKHELETEKEKFNQMVAKYQADLQNLQVLLLVVVGSMSVRLSIILHTYKLQRQIFKNIFCVCYPSHETFKM